MCKWSISESTVSDPYGNAKENVALKIISQYFKLPQDGFNSLKCHWDQNFGIPYFCIFQNSLWLLVIMPNFNSLRRLEVAFFGRFWSRFYGRHYWPLFRKLACELAELTLEAHLKPSTFIQLLAAGNLTVIEGRFPANCLLYGLEIFVAAHYLCCTMLQQKQPPSWYFASSKPCERTRSGKMDNVRTHLQCKFQPERYFCRLF